MLWRFISARYIVRQELKVMHNVDALLVFVMWATTHVGLLVRGKHLPRLNQTDYKMVMFWMTNVFQQSSSKPIQRVVIPKLQSAFYASHFVPQQW